MLGTEEVPGRVVGRGGLRDLVVWRRLHSMDQIGELRRILYEEDRNIVTQFGDVSFMFEVDRKWR